MTTEEEMQQSIDGMKPEPELTREERGKQLPQPVGIKILCAIPQLGETYDGTSIVRPDTHREREQQATVVMFVMKMGPDCYTDKERYPSGPWCKVGDFVITRTYAGTRLSIHGKPFAIIYEDQVEGVVDDPRGIGRQ